MTRSDHSPVELDVAPSDYDLIVPKDPSKPDSPLVYSHSEFYNYLLDSGIVCMVHDRARRRKWLRFDGRVYSPIDESHIMAIV